MKRWIVRLSLLLTPLALVPVFWFLVAESILNFGGGEKDLLLMIPLLIWSIVYMVIFVVGWIKGFTILRTLIYSAAGASILILLAGSILSFLSFYWLGAS